MAHHRSSLLAALVGIILFVLLAVLVQLRWLVGPDLAVAQTLSSFPNPLLRMVSTLSAIGLSMEFALLYAALFAWWLHRQGLGRWSLVPFAFLVLTCLELIMKLTIDQPNVPAWFHQVYEYPLFSLPLRGSFPSGHALRTGFLCMTAAVLLRRQFPHYGGKLGVVCGIVALGLGFTRLYLGVHWSSDVVAGLLLGSALGLIVAPALADRLSPRRPASLGSRSSSRLPSGRPSPP